MAVDPMMEKMADKLASSRQAAGRGTPVIQGPPQEVESEEPSGLAEARSLLQQAMEILDNLGAADQAEV